MKSKELREQRAGIHKDMTGLVSKVKAENRPLNADEQQVFDRMTQEMDRLLTEAEGYERIEQYERKTLEAADVATRAKDSPTRSPGAYLELKKGDHDKGVRGWLMSRHPEYRQSAEQYRQSAERCGIDYRSDHISLKFADQSSVGTGGVGEDFVPTTLASFIYRAAEYPSNILNVAQVMYTATGSTEQIPVSTDTFESVLITQNTASTQEDLNTDIKDIKSYCLTTRHVNCPVEWFRDSNFPVDQFVGFEFGRRDTRGVSKILASGTGSSQPQGYKNATQAVTVATNAALTWAKMMDLRYALPVASAESPNFSYRVSYDGAKELRTQVASDGRPLWQPSVIAGQPDLYDGRPIFVDPYLDDTSTAGNVVVVAGDWKEFLVRRVGNFEVWDQKDVTKRQIVLAGFSFVDSLLLSSTALQSLRMIAP